MRFGACRAVCSIGLLCGLLMQTAAQAARFFETVPDACSYLDEPLAVQLLGTDRVKPGAGNEHLPTIWSQCVYTGKRGKISFVFKFMPEDMFAVGKVDEDQLTFNAQFATGGGSPPERLTEPGERSFVAEGGKDTTVLMLPGIEGPKGQVMVANYLYVNPELSHAQRRQTLLGIAKAHADAWLRQ